MKRINLTTAIIVLISFGLLFSSCEKEKIDNGDTSFSKDDALAESIFNGITNITDEAYNTGSKSSRSGNESSSIMGGCAVITLDLTVFPHVLIVDFGETNCLGDDGVYRRGEINVTFNGGYREAGTVVTTSFDDFHINDHRIEGTTTLSNMGFNADSNMYFNIEIIGSIYLANDAGTITWNSSRMREWVEGYETFWGHDDVYLISGTADGVRLNGLSWSKEITNPLRVELDCRWIVSGTVNIQPENLPLRTLDFGDGECDNIATVLIDGIIYTIYLP